MEIGTDWVELWKGLVSLSLWPFTGATLDCCGLTAGRSSSSPLKENSLSHTTTGPNQMKKLLPFSTKTLFYLFKASTRSFTKLPKEAFHFTLKRQGIHV